MLFLRFSQNKKNPCKGEYLTPLFKPKHQTFLYFIKRKETFQYWSSLMFQKPLDLARNVFFFLIPVWVIVPPVFIVVCQWDREDYIFQCIINKSVFVLKNKYFISCCHFMISNTLINI